MCMSFIVCGGRTIEPTSILLIGLQGSGKSSLLEQVSAGLSGQPVATDWAPTPTYGLDVRNIKPRKDVIGGPLMLRELGGCMQRIWPQYYSDTHAVLLVVDGSCQETLAAAAVALLELSQDPAIKGKPLCVAFNKCDQPLAVPQDQLHVAFNLSAIAASYPGSFCSLHTSATTGQGAADVVAWMAACQQQVAQQAAAASKAGSPRVSLLGQAEGTVKAAARQLSVGRGSARKRNAVVPVCDEEAVPAPAPTDAAATSTAAATAAAAASGGGVSACPAAATPHAGGEDNPHVVEGQQQQQQQQQGAEPATCVIQLQGQPDQLQQAPKQQVLVGSSEQAGQQPHATCIPGVAN